MSSSCSRKEQPEPNPTFGEFPFTQQLEPTVMTFPGDEVRVIGDAAVIDSTYIFYEYDAPHFLVVTDKDFTHLTEAAGKGNGPGEVKGVTGPLGYKLSDGSIAVFDPYTTRLYGARPENGYALEPFEEFSDELTKFSPGRIIQMSDGNYIATRGDFKYGLLLYDKAAKTATELPLGYDFTDVDNPDYDVVSLRAMEYNRKNGTVAEIYGCLPTVILHDEKGDVKSAITYEGYKPAKNQDGNTIDCFNDLALTDSYIWLLYGDDTDETTPFHVFCIEYDGTPVADLLIDQAGSINIDEPRRLIIATNPNCDEANVKTYPIPDRIKF